MAYRKHRPRATSPDQLLLVHGETVGDNKEEIFEVYGSSLYEPERIMYPDALSTGKLIERIAEFKAGGAHIVLVDGAFDVPHPNHEWYLRHCRLLAAQQMLLARGDKLTINHVREAIESDLVKLIVTVDADTRISRLKGGNATKGGVNRPIYPWSARAGRLAGYTFRGQSGAYQPVVDLVTVEGDDEHVGTPLEDSLILAECLARDGLLDNLVVFGEHLATIERAKAMLITPIIVPVDLIYEVNPQTNEKWKSSSIIARAQGKAALDGSAITTSKE